MPRTLRVAAVLMLGLLFLPVGASGLDGPTHSAVYLPAVMRAGGPQCGAVRVYDYDGVERDWDWLTGTFGDVWIEKGSGSACLAELRAKHDDSTLVVTLVDSRGRPVNGVPIVFYWPDAPTLPPELAGCYDRGVYGHTARRIGADPGTVGFGMGPGAYYCPPGGGPHTVWIGLEGSDCVHGLGMLCWTNHDHLNPTFVLPGR